MAIIIMARSSGFCGAPKEAVDLWYGMYKYGV